MSSIMSNKVCVTGGAGYIGSWLVKKLLEKGHIVHATLRNLGDVKKVSLLKNLPGAESRLVLFEADLNNPEDFEHAIKGCEFVFHVATPLMQTTHNSQVQLIQIREAAVSGVRSIAECCIRSGTVKRLIYTATVIAASALKEDGTGFKDVLDESCWTPLNLQFPQYNMNLKVYSYLVSFLNELLSLIEEEDHVFYDKLSIAMAYTESKTLAEKELLKFGTKEESINGESLEVVSLVCGLTGGDTVLSNVPESMMVLLSNLKDCSLTHQSLLFIESLSGKVPIIHINDVVDAHIFSMEKPSMNGRYLCSGAFMTTMEITDYYRKNHPQLKIQQECIERSWKEVKWGSRKLQEIGFEYKYDMKLILDESIECARRLGYLTK